MAIPFSRRSVLASLSAVGTHSLLGRTLAPFSASAVASRESAALIAYFKDKAPQLLRQPQGFLRFPSISPTLPRSTYSSELWDWDTLWTARGLFRLARLTNNGELHGRVCAHVLGSLQNFFDHQSPEGRIPMLISVDHADPLGCLKGHRPHKENQSKPVLAQLALLLAVELLDTQWCRPLLPQLEAFYASWKLDNLSSSGLYVWGDDVAIGNDNDPTTFGRPFFSSANLLLNCLFYKDLQAAAELARRLQQPGTSARFAADATALASAIQRHCWDPRDRFFYTADVQCIDRRAELIPDVPRGMSMSWSSIPMRIQTFTGFLPMWCGISTKDQNAALIKHLQNPETFSSRSGVRTLSAREAMYSLERSTNPSNWLGPIWIISNYLVWQGLTSAGYNEQATALAAATVTMLARDLASSGSLNEYYHPDTGLPLSHTGFMDWNLLVLEMLGPSTT